jgi:hypothetical protein
MEQNSLFHESLYEANRATVAALGGAKAVAQALYPEKSPDDAVRYLLDCLNPDRNAELHPEKLLMLYRIARAKGIHTGISYFVGEAGYAATPIEPEDEVASLERDFIASAQRMEDLVKRIERLRQRPEVRLASIRK